MAQKDRQQLKGYFQTGKYPSQENFEDLIDSSFNQVDDEFGEAGNMNLSGVLVAQNVIRVGVMSENRDIHIAPLSGQDDETADGSPGAPYKSLDFPIRNFPATVTGKVNFIFSEKAEVNLSQATLNLLANIAWTKNPVIVGAIGLVRDDFETEGHPDQDNGYVKSAKDAADQPIGWAANAYNGYLARYDTHAPTYYYGLLGGHKESELKSPRFTDGFDAGAIYELQTTFNFPENRLDPTIPFTAGRAITFKNCKITNPNNKDLKLYNDSIRVKNCVITPGRTLKMSGSAKINQCLINTSSKDNRPLISIGNGMQNSLTSNMIEHTNPDALEVSKPCISLEHGTSLDYQKNYMSGFPVGVEYQPKTSTYSRYGHYPNYFENIGVLYDIKGSDTANILSEWYGLHSIRLFGCNYLFALNGGTNMMHFVIQENQLFGDLPSNGAFVPQAGGTWNGKPNILKAIADAPPQNIDTVRQNSFYVHGILN